MSKGWNTGLNMLNWKCLFYRWLPANCCYRYCHLMSTQILKPSILQLIWGCCCCFLYQSASPRCCKAFIQISCLLVSVSTSFCISLVLVTHDWIISMTENLHIGNFTLRFLLIAWHTNQCLGCTLTISIKGA